MPSTTLLWVTRYITIGGIIIITVIAILLPERAMPPAVIWLTICGRVLSYSVNTVPFGTDAHISLNVKRNTVKVAGFIIGSTIEKNMR